MIRVALKGLLGRKLRTALTAIAIVLGVAMVSRHVRADRLDRQGVRLDLHRRPQGLERRRSAASRRSTSSTRRGSSHRRSTTSLLPKVRGAARRRAGRGQRRRRGAADRQGRQGDRLRRRAEPRLQHRERRLAASTRSRSSTGSWPQRRRGGDRRVDGEQGALRRSATAIGVQAEGPVAEAAHLGIRHASAPSRRSAARRSPASTCRPRSSCSTSAGQLDEIAVAAKPDVTDEQLVGEVQAVLPPTAQVETGVATGARTTRPDTNELHLVPARLPARVRRDRALRRQLRDRELALDHDRAADARVRDAANVGASRRQVLTSIVIEALVDRACSPRWSGSALGVAAREGPLRALRRRRLHAAEQRPHPRADDGRDRARCGHHRHAASRACGLRSARPACHRSRPCARARRLPESRFARFLTLGIDPPDRRSASRLCSWSLFGPGLSTTGVARLDGHRRAADLPRRRAARGTPRTPARDRRSAGPRRSWAAPPGRSRATTLSATRSATASTASALMIGLALVTLVTLLAAGIIDHLPRRGRRRSGSNADYAVTAQNNFSPIPVSVARDAAARRPASDAVGSVSAGQAAAFGEACSTPPPSTPTAAQDVLARLEGRLRRGAGPTSATTAPSSTTGYARRPRPEGRLDVSTDLRQRRIRRTSACKGIFEPPIGRLAVRPGHDLGQHVGSLQRPARSNLYSFVIMQRRRDGREPGRARPDARGTSRTRRCRRGRSSSTTRSPG